VKKSTNSKSIDLSGWQSFERCGPRTLNIDRNAIMYKIKKHPKINGKLVFHIYLYNRSLEHLNLKKGERVFVYHHKDDNKRIMIFKSENGYTIVKPQRGSSGYIKFIIIDSKMKPCDPVTVVPIFHPKNMIEFVME